MPDRQKYVFAGRSQHDGFIDDQYHWWIVGQDDIYTISVDEFWGKEPK